MVAEELGLTWTEAWLVVVAVIGIYAAVIVYSRIGGQRQFARMSTFDLAAVFGIGAVIGRVALVRTSLLAGVLALAVLFAAHAAVGYLRHHVPMVQGVIDNRPVLLMAGPRLLPANLRRAHTTDDEICQQLRLAGVGSFDQVRCVIMERNGELSVITRDVPLDPRVFQEVVGREELRAGGGPE
jgi:uncharacterized membrane protein YcaP (DUF421 family)